MNKARKSNVSPNLLKYENKYVQGTFGAIMSQKAKISTKNAVHSIFYVVYVFIFENKRFLRRVLTLYVIDRKKSGNVKKQNVKLKKNVRNGSRKSMKQ
jgi:hypothetical protein